MSVSAGWSIYCDESCHLELDRESHMVMGALACPKDRTRDIAAALRAVKEKHGVHPNLELKWTKVSSARLALFSDYLDVFLTRRDLIFRAVVVQKSQLDHSKFFQTHDDFYYKMFSLLLVYMPVPSVGHDKRFIYLDIKDTKSEAKVQGLARRLRADLDGVDIARVQHIRSHEVEQAQLADILIGAVSYVNRGLLDKPGSSPAKRALIEKLRGRTRLSLTKTTSSRAYPVNILVWKGVSGEPL